MNGCDQALAEAELWHVITNGHAGRAQRRDPAEREADNLITLRHIDDVAVKRCEAVDGGGYCPHCVSQGTRRSRGSRRTRDRNVEAKGRESGMAAPRKTTGAKTAARKPSGAKAGKGRKTVPATATAERQRSTAKVNGGRPRQPSAEASQKNLAALLTPMADLAAKVEAGGKLTPTEISAIGLACRRGYSMTRKLRGLSA